MSTWLAIPSKRPLSECGPTLDLWRAQGYKIALFRDIGEDIPCDLLIAGKYPGYGAAINKLARAVFELDQTAGWIVTGGDDTEPDPNKTSYQIAVECTTFFLGTFGVMQPIGDGHGIDSICGSPWIGRDFCRRMYGGNGPYCEEYRHMFDDQELQHVALMLGVLWQRKDLTHKHNHWTWTTGQCPDFLKDANSRAHWDRVRDLFHRRHDQRFPGHEPIA